MYKKVDKPEVIDYPVMGRLYKHYKGGTYKVISMAKDSGNADVVIYRSVLFGSIHTRPLKDFMEKLTYYEGKLRINVRRFQPI